jgi:hypothetical protein
LLYTCPSRRCCSIARQRSPPYMHTQTATVRTRPLFHRDCERLTFASAHSSPPLCALPPPPVVARTGQPWSSKLPAKHTRSSRMPARGKCTSTAIFPWILFCRGVMEEHASWVSQHVVLPH